MRFYVKFNYSSAYYIFHAVHNDIILSFDGDRGTEVDAADDKIYYILVRI